MQGKCPVKQLSIKSAFYNSEDSGAIATDFSALAKGI